MAGSKKLFTKPGKWKDLEVNVWGQNWLKGQISLTFLVKAQESKYFLVITKEVKRGIRSLFDRCINAIAAAAILSVTYGGWVIVPLDCVSVNSTNYRCHTFTVQKHKMFCGKPEKQKNLEVQ